MFLFTGFEVHTCYTICTPERAQGEMGDRRLLPFSSARFHFCLKRISDELIRVQAANQAEDMRFVVTKLRNSEVS
jgi:hypothetical protein